MNTIWMRLGGWISADEETMDAIRVGDVDALIKAIRLNGFSLNGESYMPDNEDVVFDLGPEQLMLRADWLNRIVKGNTTHKKGIV